jgi:hypothetical protein
VARSALDATQLGVEMDDDPLITEHVQDGCRDISVLAARDLRARLNEGDATAEPAIGLC